MADVFISYSQGAPEPTQELAADLSKQRYAVWFDSRMLPMEVFWKVIQEKIRAARAVIVIWSEPSITSEWVYSEAKLGHDLKKLVCVRTPDVSPADVPLPFNGYNLSLVSEREKIYESLARLGVRQAAAAPVLPRIEREASEAALAWDHIRESRDAADFELFFKHYGDGHAFYGTLAAKKIAELKGAPVATRPSATAAAVPMPKAEDVFLRIEAGMHTAMINRISLAADGRLLATASDDKTVRLWSLPDGNLLRTLRPPIGPGDDGKVYAVALSPEGKWVAAGGWDVGHRLGTEDGCFIYVFHTETAIVHTRLGPLPSRITDLEFSPSGACLAAGIRDSNGVRIWETESWRQVAEDKNYGDSVYGLSFAADGRLAATGWDSHVRLYGADGKLTGKAKAPGGARPFGIAFSPDGARLAVGHVGTTTRVDVLSGQTLARLLSPDASGISSGDLGTVAWLAGSARLAAAGRYQRAMRIRSSFGRTVARASARLSQGPQTRSRTLPPGARAWPSAPATPPSACSTLTASACCSAGPPWATSAANASSTLLSLYTAGGCASASSKGAKTRGSSTSPICNSFRLPRPDPICARPMSRACPSTAGSTPPSPNSAARP
jgi:hypothetical protein